DLSGIMTEAVRDYWRTHIYPLDETVATEIYSHWKTPQALLADIMPRLGFGCDPQTPEDADSLAAIVATGVEARREKAAALKQPWREWLTDLEERFAAARQLKLLNGQKLKADSCSRWLMQIRQW